MTVTVPPPIDVDLGELRQAIQTEYAEVALHPTKGFHFHTGRPLARLLGYADAWLVGIPEASIGRLPAPAIPSASGLRSGEHVVDVGCGAGIDSLIAASMVELDGQVIGVDMTPAMLEKGRRSAAAAGLNNVAFRQGYGEALPVPDGWADVVISNGVLNLFPDKSAGLREMTRVLKPGGDCRLATSSCRRPCRRVPNANRSLDGLNCRCSAGCRA